MSNSGTSAETRADTLMRALREETIRAVSAAVVDVVGPMIQAQAAALAEANGRMSELEARIMLVEPAEPVPPVDPAPDPPAEEPAPPVEEPGPPQEPEPPAEPEEPELPAEPEPPPVVEEPPPAPDPTPDPEPEPPEEPSVPPSVDPPVPPPVDPLEPPVPGFVIRDTIVGTGAPSGAVIVTGLEFHPGEMPDGHTVALTTEDGTPLAVQAHSHVEYTAGGQRIMRVAVEMPHIPAGETLAVLRYAVPAGPPPAPMGLASALSGRSVVVEMSSAFGGDWSFDALGAATPTDWLVGPLARSMRAETTVPAWVVGCTSMRLITDIRVLSDGAIDADVRFHNDIFNQAGGGLAHEFTFRILIDGHLVRTVGPDDLGQYRARIYNGYRRADGVAVPVLPERLPDPDRLPVAGVGHTVDRSQAAEVLASSAPRKKMWFNDCFPGRDNDTKYLWGYKYGIGDVGGRIEIGTYPEPVARWLVGGDIESLQWAMCCARAATERPFFMYDPVAGRQIDLDIAPRFTNFGESVLGTPLDVIRGYPKGQPRAGLVSQGQDDIGLETDNQHLGSHYAYLAFQAMRPWLFDALAATAAYVALHNNLRFNGVSRFSTVPTHYNNKPLDYVTGVAVAPAPDSSLGVRGWANGEREIALASMLLPESYPNRDWFDRLAAAWVSPRLAIQTQLEEEIGEFWPFLWSNQGLATGYMNRYADMALILAGYSDRPGSERVRQYAEAKLGAWIESFHRPGEWPWIISASGVGHHVFEPKPDGTTGGTSTAPTKTWKRAGEVAHLLPNRGYDVVTGGWAAAASEGDYHRSAKTVAGMAAKTPWFSAELRRKSADALVMIQSERTDRSSAKPGIRPVTYATGWATPNSRLTAQGMSYRVDLAPVIRDGQVFRASAAGVPMQAAEWDGSIPRMSAPGANDAFGYGELPEAGVLGVTVGGAPVWIELPPPGTYTATMWAASWDDLLVPRVATDLPPVEHRGPAVPITLIVE